MICRRCGNQLSESSNFCSKCGEVVNCSETNLEINRFKPSKGTVKSVVGGLLVISIWIYIFSIACGTPSTPIHRDVNDLTNKEMQDFQKWQKDQDQKKWDNQKHFK